MPRTRLVLGVNPIVVGVAAVVSAALGQQFELLLAFAVVAIGVVGKGRANAKVLNLVQRRWAPVLIGFDHYGGPKNEAMSRF